MKQKCPAARYCGGCRYQGTEYSEQLKMKQERMESLLSSFGKVSQIIGMDDPYHYRNKVQMNYAYDEHHNIISGYYVEGSHVIVPIDECQICDENINRILYSIKRIVSRLHISIFDERIMRGCLRHVLVRSTNKGEYMAVLVTGSPNIVKKEQLLNEILRYNPDVKTIVQNINRSRTSMVLGPRNVTLYGKGYITDHLCGLDFRISPSSFYQVNRRQTEILYRTAIETADLRKDEILLDAYCGTGTIGLSAAASVNRVIGVEVNPSAVKDAQINRKINGIGNADFICEDAGKYMEQLAKERKHIDTVIMDPPRVGSDDRFLKSLMRLSPDKVVYISCNPVTLKRDLNVLKKQYRIEKIQSVDMFPFTEHVETVVLLRRDEKEEKKMISDEKSRYKSWSNLKSQMNGLLCDSLKDKIQYFYTTYHEVHNAYGRATIDYNKKEMVAFSWVEMYAQEYEMSQLYKEGKKISYGEMEKKKWMPEGKLCEIDFINSITIYLKTDISSSLTSDNLLLRVFAYMDRRVGKRTLIRIKDDVEKLPEWVKQFYRLRCEAENINFQQNQTTDETVVLLSRK